MVWRSTEEGSLTRYETTQPAHPPWKKWQLQSCTCWNISWKLSISENGDERPLNNFTDGHNNLSLPTCDATGHDPLFSALPQESLSPRSRFSGHNASCPCGGGAQSVATIKTAARMYRRTAKRVWHTSHDRKCSFSHVTRPFKFAFLPQVDPPTASQVPLARNRVWWSGLWSPSSSSPVG